MKRATRAGLAKADEDLRAAQRLMESGEDFNDTICFHCQQAAEKHLKALLCELAIAIPHIHDLTALAKRLTPHVSGVIRLGRRLSSLSEFAVDYRYPGIESTLRQTRTSLQSAVMVQELCHRWLGLHKGSRRKRS